MKEKLQDRVDLIDSRISIIQSDISRLQVELDDLKGKINLKQDKAECNCGCKEYKPIKANKIYLDNETKFVSKSKTEEDSDSIKYSPVRVSRKDKNSWIDLDSGEFYLGKNNKLWLDGKTEFVSETKSKTEEDNTEFTIKASKIDGLSSTVENTSVKIDANGIKIKVNKGEVVVTEDGLIISIN